MVTNEHMKIKQMHDENREDLPEKPALGPIPIWILSDEDIIGEWNKAILELSQKEEKLIQVKQEYSQKSSTSNMLRTLILKNYTVKQMMIPEISMLKLLLKN